MNSSLGKSEILIDFLSELAKLLIVRGVDALVFQRSAQMAFVQAAIQDARLRNSRVNQSAVAAITGLSRPQVRALIRLAEKVGTDPTVVAAGRLDRIQAAWRSDPEFLDKYSRPRPLSLDDKAAGFNRLASKYASDVSQPALVGELVRLRIARKRGNRLYLIRGSARDSAADSLAAIAAGIAHVIRDIPREPLASFQVLTGGAEYDSPDPTAALLLQRRIAQGVRALCADIQSAGEATASGRRRGAQGRKTRTRVLVITGS